MDTDIGPAASTTSQRRSLTSPPAYPQHRLSGRPQAACPSTQSLLASVYHLVQPQLTAAKRFSENFPRILIPQNSKLIPSAPIRVTRLRSPYISVVYITSSSGRLPPALTPAPPPSLRPARAGGTCGSFRWRSGGTRLQKRHVSGLCSGPSSAANSRGHPLRSDRCPACG